MKDKVSVLVVDDNKIIRMVLATFLESKGFEVSLAENGERAIETLQINKYDAVITDMEMGATSGLEVIRFVKKYFSDTIVIMITGNYESSLQKDAEGLGVDDFFHKPFEFSSLLRSLPGRLMASPLNKSNNRCDFMANSGLSQVA